MELDFGLALVLTALLVYPFPLTVRDVMAEGSPPSREIEMGEFEKIGSWPEDIVVEDSRIMYLPGELIVFARDTDASNEGPLSIWSYFESNNTWAKIGFQGEAPDVRLSSPAFATNPSEQTAYFYGGVEPGASRSDEIFFYYHMNRTWVKPVMPNAPSGRTSASMVYDEGRDLLWIFGGQVSQNSRSDRLYSFSLTDGWTEYNPSTKPGARTGACMEIVGDRIFIAIGYLGGWSGYATDMWAFNITLGTWSRTKEDLGVWTDSGAAFVFDDISGYLLMTLGFYYRSGGGGGTTYYLNHTYRIQPSNGSIERVYIDPKITPREVQAWTVDDGDIIIFGGSQGQQDVWRLDISDLSAEGMAPTTYNSGGTSFTGFDTDSQSIYILSRRSNSFGDGDSYQSWLMTYYTFADNMWHYMDVDTPAGFYHSDLGFTYDPVGNKFYFYGGSYSYQYGSGPGAETHYYFYDAFWSLDVMTGTWVRIHEHAKPGILGKPGMVVDNTQQYPKLYLFGGQIPLGTSSEVAVYNISGGTWTKLNVPVKPPGRYDTPLVMAPSMKAFVMFGGRDNSSNTYDDLWMFHTDTEKWEQLSGAVDPPSTRYDHGLAVNPINNEIMVYGKYAGGWGGGDPDDTVYLYRPGWKEWIAVEDETAPHAWYSHGQVYNPADKMVYLWMGPSEPSAIYRYSPILRTISEGARVVDSSGDRKTDVYPTVQDYKLRLTGYTDLGTSDILGMNVEMRASVNNSLIIKYQPGKPLELSGNTTWARFDGTGQITSDSKNGWTLDIPLEFTIDAPEGVPISLFHSPITAKGYTEPRQALNSFTLHSDLEVSRVTFTSEIQPDGIVPDGWIFGHANITVSGFQLSFSADSSKHPTNSSFIVTFANQEGTQDSWEYNHLAVENLTVPIAGADGSEVYFYLNVTDLLGNKINSQVFHFYMDQDAPAPPRNLSVRADSFEDTVKGIDNDQEVYLYWDSVFDGGAGVKGICYSMDVNNWPSQDNIINEPRKFNLQEGNHTFYVWTVDKAERAGPVAEVPILIDLHRPVFWDPSPKVKINITDETYEFTVRVRDDLTGLRTDAFRFRALEEDNDWGEWQTVHEAIVQDVGFLLKSEITLMEKRENLVQFFARDLVGNTNESMVMAIFTDPSLAAPVVGIVKPASDTRTQGKILLEWEGDYIDPSAISYELVITDPLGGTDNIPMGKVLSLNYAPMIPGTYGWKVVCTANDIVRETETRTFIYNPPFASISTPTGISVDQNQTFDLTFTVDNDLSIGVNLTFEPSDLQGFKVLGGTEFPVTSGKGRTVTLILNASSAIPGSRKLSFNVSDEFGRFALVQVTVTVKAPTDGGEVPDGSEKEDSILPFVIIGIVAVLLIAGIVGGFVLMRRKKDITNMKVEPPEDDVGRVLWTSVTIRPVWWPRAQEGPRPVWPLPPTSPCRGAHPPTSWNYRSKPLQHPRERCRWEQSLLNSPNEYLNTQSRWH